MKNLAFVIFFFSFLLNPNYIKANEAILFVDSVLILNNSLAGKSINNQLKTLNTKNIKYFKKIENDLKLEESKLLSQKNVLEVNQYMKKVDDFKIKVNKFNENKKNTIVEFNKKKKDVELVLSNMLANVLSDYAKKESVSLILPKQSILLGKNELDITETIKNNLDLKIKTINIK
tara:strand:- start:1397 stop:1921 length:525 start_codon:yes stop_codon:yes gene_type:complete